MSSRNRFSRAAKRGAHQFLDRYLCSELLGGSEDEFVRVHLFVAERHEREDGVCKSEVLIGYGDAPRR